MPRTRSEIPGFEGWDPPRYTSVPDQLFDQVMVHLTLAETRVLLYIIRRTFGFKKDADNISISQMVNGIRTRDGRVLDHGTGLSKRHVLAAIQSLKDRRLIVTERRQSAAKGDEPTTYSLNFRTLYPVDTSGSQGVGTQGNHPLVTRRSPGGGNPRGPRGWAPEVATQETELQDTEEQETEQETDPSNIREGHPHQDISEDGDTLAWYVRDLAGELGDRAPLKSSVTRALNLRRRAGVSPEEFVDRLQEAREIIKQHLGRIRGERRPGRPKAAMSYFFAVLERLLGVKGEQPPTVTD